MRDNWFNHSTDKLLLFILVVLGGLLILHIMHHDSGDMQAVTWAENSFSTVLGALILILTGRIARSDGQTANGLPPTPTPKDPNSPQEMK